MSLHAQGRVQWEAGKHGTGTDALETELLRGPWLSVGWKAPAELLAPRTPPCSAQMFTLALLSGTSGGRASVALESLSKQGQEDRLSQGISWSEQYK